MAKNLDLKSLGNIDTVFFFDSECGLCDATVFFLIKNSKQNSISFCSLQSEIASKFFKQKKIDISKKDSAYLLDNGKIHNRSCAILQSLKMCNGLIKFFFFLIFIPKKLRDVVYVLVSRIRTRIPFSGNKCNLLSASEIERII